MEHIHLLNSLLNCRGSLQYLEGALKAFSWDSEELLCMGSAQLSGVLQRFISGELSAAEIGTWANLIECRDDVGYESAVLKEAVHFLANPELSPPLDPAKAHQLIASL